MIPIAAESVVDQKTHDVALVTSVAETLGSIAAKQAIRNSLRASTLDGVFATIFSTITGGVLLSNFLVELHATPTQIGMLSSIPMLANLLQPLGAWLGDRVPSRHNYCLWVYAPSRLLWLLLVAGIAIAHGWGVDATVLVWGTLAIVCLTHVIGAFGSASWLSWLAALVPRRLRGRYFGLRNSAASLTNLLCVPLLGFAISTFPGGSMQGFEVLLLVGVVAGMISLGFQFLMVDVNPQRQWGEGRGEEIGGGDGDEEVGEAEGAGEAGRAGGEIRSQESKLSSAAAQRATQNSKLKTQNSKLSSAAAQRATQNSKFKIQNSPRLPTPDSRLPHFLQDKNFLFFLLYFSAWAFAVNLSAPFFNLYMLDNLAIEVSWVTLYTSLQAGATMIMLVVWGRLVDRVGNRPILLAVGIVVAISPLLWLGAGANELSVWLWLPLLHVLAGVTWAAIDLGNNNLQLGVAPVQQQATYFAIVAAIGGISGALGTTVGGFLAEFADYGGIPGLFALSAIVRLVALLPLILVHEQRGQSLHQMMQVLFPSKSESSKLEPSKSEPSKAEPPKAEPPKAEPILEPAPAAAQSVLLEAQLDDGTHCMVRRSATMEE